MRDDAFRAYFKKLKPIIDDCVVSAKVAQSDPEKYELYKMCQRCNAGVQVGYDREKVKKHAETLREIFTEIPRGKLLSVQVVFIQDLVSESALKEVDPKKKAILIRQQANSAEIFLAMSEEVGIVSVPCPTDKNPDVYAVRMREHIPTTYEGSRSMDSARANAKRKRRLEKKEAIQNSMVSFLV